MQRKNELEVCQATGGDGCPAAGSQQPLPNPSQEHYKAEAEKFVASLPAPVQQRVGTLKDLQTKRNSLEAEFKKELEALEEKYRQLYGMYHGLWLSTVAQTMLVYSAVV